MTHRQVSTENARRAGEAVRALKASGISKNGSERDDLVDLLTAVMHRLYKIGAAVHRSVDVAIGHFETESRENVGCPKWLAEESGQVRRLSKALKAAAESLAGWMEIAEDEDRREYDDEAMAMAQAALEEVGVSIETNCKDSRGELIEQMGAALKECLDALFNETHGQPDSHWIKSVKVRSGNAIEAWEKQREGGHTKAGS